jgi:hypothetical protein
MNGGQEPFERAAFTMKRVPSYALDANASPQDAWFMYKTL